VSSPDPFPRESSGTPVEAGDSLSGGPGCDGFSSSRDAGNRLRFGAWLLAAMLVYLGATAAVRWRESVPAALVWSLVGLAGLLAIQAARSYLVFLRSVDELRRKIETEALAFGFAAGAALSLFYPLLEGLGAPRLDGDVAAAVMMLAAGAGYWLGTRRYSGGDGA